MQFTVAHYATMNSRMDKFANIQAFVTVVESQSFSVAGERLGLSKSLISRRVSQLEQSLSAQLLQRTTRRLTLTESGQQFYSRAKQLLEDLADAETEVGEHQGELKGSIKIAAPLSFGLSHLPDIIARFMEEHPEIELDIDLNDREINLIEEGVDLALRIGRLRDSSLIARKLSSIHSIACASPEYLTRYGTPYHPNELDTHYALHYSNISLKDQWRFIGKDGKDHFAQPKIRMHANNGNVLAEAAIKGAGITRAPTFILNEHILNGRLIPLLTSYTGSTIGLYALYPPGRLLPRRVRVLSDYLAQAFGNDTPYWDACLNNI